MPKVPVIVLSGFLGSGKTTLLLQLLHEARSRGLRPAVLMNELGSKDVDGEIINEMIPGQIVEKLMDGCICCSKKSEITGSVQQLLRTQPDILVIELTGVANPEEIADSLTEPFLLNRVEMKKIITLLDAENVLDYNSIFASDRELVHTLRRQIEVADLIVVNKIDLVTSTQLNKIEKAIQKQNALSPILYTTRSRIDTSKLFEGITTQERKEQAFNNRFQTIKPITRTAVKELEAQDTRSEQETHQHKHENTAMSFSRVKTFTLLLKPTERVTTKQLEHFLKQWGEQLLRAKGFLTLAGDDEMIRMQFSGKRPEWQATDYHGEPYLVFIGLDLDQAKVEKEWYKLVNDI